MALETDSVNRRAVRLELLDEVEHGSGFCTAVFDVVVVNVEFGVGVCGPGSTEGNVDVGGTEDVVEDV